MQNSLQKQRRSARAKAQASTINLTIVSCSESIMFSKKRVSCDWLISAPSVELSATRLNRPDLLPYANRPCLTRLKALGRGARRRRRSGRRKPRTEMAGGGLAAARAPPICGGQSKNISNTTKTCLCKYENRENLHFGRSLILKI